MAGNNAAILQDVIGMLDMALKEFRIHRARTVLTSLGIIIAISAIVGLGSISSGINVMVEGTLSQIGADKIMVTKKMEFTGLGAPMAESFDEDVAEEIKQLDGVDDALPIVRTVYLGSIPVIGADEKHREFMQFTDAVFKEGGWYDDADTDAIVLGKDLAEAQGLAVGDTMKFGKHAITVVGVIEAGEMRGANMMAIMPYREAQDVLDMEGKATLVIVKPTDISLTDSVKLQIRDEFDDFEAMTTEDILKSAQKIIGTLTVVTLGIGFIASLVAAIGIIITMMTSISERKRQIGIMKAVGAKGRDILVQVLQESVIISVASGMVGVAIGWVAVEGMNAALFAGIRLAVVTPLLAAGALSYGIALSLGSALYPAWKASKVDPIEAIRS